VLLNPASAFFQERFRMSHSCVGKARHLDLTRIEAGIAEVFRTRSEYYLGISGSSLFESNDPASAALYVINGERKEPCL